MRASKRTLTVLAALVWYGGGVALLVKGSSYIFAAAALHIHLPVPWAVAAAGLVVGSLRGRAAFARGCRKNLTRIAALENPRLWQFFRPGFLLALIPMVGAGVLLRAIADAGGFWAETVVGSLELMISLALLTSSVEFWLHDRTNPSPVPARGGKAGGRDDDVG